MVIRIVGSVLQDVGIEAVRMEDVLVFEGQHDDPSADLVLGYFNAQHLLVGEGQLGQHHHVAVVLPELPRGVEREHGRQLNGLRVGRLGFLLVRELHADFLDVVGNLRFVAHRKVDEEVIPDGVDVVDRGLHPVRPRHDLVVLAPAAVHRPRIACHLGHGHGDFRVDVGLRVGVRHLEDGGRLSRLFGIKDVILRDVSFPDERDGAQQLVLRVAAGPYGIALIVVRLDADDVVRALVACNLWGGDVHQLDGFGHDDVRGHVPVDIDFLVGVGGHAHGAEQSQ